MRIRTKYGMSFIPILLLLVIALPASAGVNYQCPANLLTQGNPANCAGGVCFLDVKNPANSSDPGCKNPSDLSNCKPQIDPVTGQASGATTNPNVVCRAIVCGDGHAYMGDRDRTGNDPSIADIYIFGFGDVTGTPENLIMTKGMPMSTAGVPRGAASIAAPTFFAREGQEFYLTLTNVGMIERPDLFDAHTVHYHGFPNAAPVFDGEPMASFGIRMGSSLTYYYNNIYAGTYMWHCHVEAAEHMQMGMLGNLFILPKQDGTSHGTCNGAPCTKFAFDDCPTPGDPMCGTTGYNLWYFIQETGFDPIFHHDDHTYNPVPFADMNDTYMLFNGRGYPDTVNPAPITNVNGYVAQPMPAIAMTVDGGGNRIPATITHGQKVLIRLSSLVTTDFFSVAVLGIPMHIVGQGAQLLRGPTGMNTSYTTGSVMLGGGEAVDVILDTTNVSPGTYFIYTTRLNYLSNNTEDFGGMMTEIVVQ